MKIQERRRVSKNNMAKSSSNKNLHSAKNSKKDEFYTQLVDTDIPCDYAGAMGVPITFVDKYNPD
jgi:hypothetical protein